MTETAKRLGETQAALDLKTLAEGGPPITDEDRLKCALREVALRKNVYPKRIEKGYLIREKAEREIAIMASIVADYTARRAPPAIRCDECDNGLEADWSWCPRCGAITWVGRDIKRIR